MKKIWHPWSKWECFRSGFYMTTSNLKPDEAKLEYAKFLSDTPRFSRALRRVLAEWPISCEHFLSNEGINRIAWLGQASMCIETGVPSCFRGGFKMLTKDEQDRANEAALQALNLWLESKNESTLKN